MKLSLVGLLALCLPLVACDTPNSTGLLLRPVPDSTVASRKMDIPFLINTISSILRENGFERQHIRRRIEEVKAKSSQPFIYDERFISEYVISHMDLCGQPYFWKRPLRDKFETIVDVCISDGEVRIALTDTHISIFLSEETKVLREKLTKSFAEKLPSMKTSMVDPYNHECHARDWPKCPGENSRTEKR